MFNSKILNIDYFLLNIDYLSFNPLSFIEYLSLKGNSKPLNIDYSFLHACSQCSPSTWGLLNIEYLSFIKYLSLGGNSV